MINKYILSYKSCNVNKFFRCKMKYGEYERCTLCHRACGINRYEKLGFCKSGADVKLARAALHMWEEPPISGTRGSGTIFFSGCSMSCIYCQNREISRGDVGAVVSTERLSEIMLELEEQGAHNINLVTPTHFAPTVIDAVALSKTMGLSIPIVYNTGNYDTKETLRALRGTVDIYLPDAKYRVKRTARLYSNAEKYPEVFLENIAEMLLQTGGCSFDKDGIMKRGVIARVLLLPSHLAEAKLIVSDLYRAFGDDIYISLMSQYTPPSDMPSPLDRKVTRSEYNELVDYAMSIGVKNAFIQEGTAADESFIPSFDLRGVHKNETT